jgi:hypothetical protein
VTGCLFHLFWENHETNLSNLRLISCSNVGGEDDCFLVPFKSVVMVVRRMLLVVLLVILVPHFFMKWIPFHEREVNPIKELQADGEVTQIKVGKTVNIDDDRFTVDRVYVTSKQIVITYTFRREPSKFSWSFPTMALKLVMPDGEKLESHGGGSGGTRYGERGSISYSIPTKPASSAKLIYDIYDRYSEIEIPLTDGGAGT